MFPTRYFPDRYFTPRYWPKVGAEAAAPSEPADEHWDVRCAEGNRSRLLGAENFRGDLRSVENVRLGIRGDL